MSSSWINYVWDRGRKRPIWSAVFFLLLVFCGYLLLRSPVAQHLADELAAHGNNWLCRQISGAPAKSKGVLVYVVLSRLTDDSGGDQTDHIRRWLDSNLANSGAGNLISYKVDCNYEIGDSKGQSHLQELRADLLIEGKVVVRNESLEITLLSQSDFGTTDMHKSYSLIKPLYIPSKDFDEDFGRELALILRTKLLDFDSLLATKRPASSKLLYPGSGVTWTYPAYDSSYPPNYIEEEVSRITLNYSATLAISRINMMRQGPARCQLEYTLGRLAVDLATAGDKLVESYLEEAQARFRTIVTSKECVQDDLLITRAYQYEGDALLLLGHYNEAALTYRQVLQNTSLKPSDPLSWAATQNNLGSALYQIAINESGITNLQQASAAFRAALAVYKQEQMRLLAKNASVDLDASETSISARRKAPRGEAPVLVNEFSGFNVSGHMRRPVAKPIAAAPPRSFLQFMYQQPVVRGDFPDP
jgi:tetratricopeptide (TPR) repeat protein